MRICTQSTYRDRCYKEENTLKAELLEHLKDGVLNDSATNGTSRLRLL